MMNRFPCAALLINIFIILVNGEQNQHIYFLENFDNLEAFQSKWVPSLANLSREPSTSYKGKWELEEFLKGADGKHFVLKMTDAPNHFALSSLLEKSFVFDKEDFIFQYEIKLPLSLQCGGSYVKLLSTSEVTAKLTQMRDDSPYSIMFGPDKCGNEKKLHFIFRHKNPKTNQYEEKHMNKIEPKVFEHIFTDDVFHLFQLIIKPDNTFKIFLDKKLIKSGSLLDSFTPAVNPPAEINDPEDKEPSDWDNREKIPDPKAVKPDSWNENEPRLINDPKAKMPSTWKIDASPMVPDPNSTQPDDWNEAEDGEWEQSMIPNPECASGECGEWKHPQIPNPNYKGPWAAPLIKNPNYKGSYVYRKIPNPDYYNDEHPFKMDSIGAIGFELWTVNPNTMFDSILLTSSLEFANDFTSKTYDAKVYLQRMDNLKNFHKSRYFIPLAIVLGVVVLLLVIYKIFVAPAMNAKPADEDKKHDKEVDENNADEPKEEIKENLEGENIRKRTQATAKEDLN